jgi:mannose-6-phosphate isomerase
MSGPLEPLRFERHFVEKVWGGRALATRPGIGLPPDLSIGETWEVVDRENENSVVAQGRFRGRTLRQLMAEHGAEILGDAPAAKEGRFPLLVKYLDASQDLSVQVHPDEDSAARAGGEAKTEAWVVLDVLPGGRVYAGLKSGVEPEAFARVAAGPEVVEMLGTWDVEPGDCFLVRGGTVHAIGAGVTILEIQQNSDTTYRLYDWGRVGLDGRPRETHVAEALTCARFGGEETRPARPRWPEPEGGLARVALARSHVFALDGLRIGAEVRLGTEGSYRIYAVLGGSGELTVEASSETVGVSTGDVWLVPAVCGYHRFAPAEGELQLVAAAPVAS